MFKAKDRLGKTRTLLFKQDDLARCHITFRAENGLVAITDHLIASGEKEDPDGFGPVHCLHWVDFMMKALSIAKMWRQAYSDEVSKIDNFLYDARNCCREARDQAASIEFEIKHFPKHTHIVVPELKVQPRKKINTRKKRKKKK